MNKNVNWNWLAIGALAVAAAGAFLIGPPPDEAPTTSSAAVEASKASTLQVLDPVHDREIDVSVWTPSPGGDRGELILISHGFAGDRTSHADLAQKWVSEGYTVAAPTHPDVAGLESGDPTLDPLVLRPRHLSLTIDALEDHTGSSFDSVTTVGHSLGGYSALRMAGAQPILDGALDAHCDEHVDEFLCTEQSRQRFEVATQGGADLSDPRVKSVVLLAPGYGPIFGNTTQDVDADVMVVAARSDQEVPGSQVSNLAALVDAEQYDQTAGGHFVFLRPCTDAEAARVRTVCEDPEGVDRTAVHAELSDSVMRFIGAV